MEMEVWIEQAVTMGVAIATFVGGIVVGRRTADSRDDRDHERGGCKNDAEVLKGIRLFLVDWEEELKKKLQGSRYAYMDVSDSKIEQFLASRKQLQKFYRGALSEVDKIEPSLLVEESKSAVATIRLMLSWSEQQAEAEHARLERDILSYVDVFSGIEDAKRILYIVKESQPYDLLSSEKWNNSKSFLRDVEISMNTRAYAKSSEFRKGGRRQ